MKKKESAPILIGQEGDSLREAFGKALVELAPSYPEAVVLDADVAGGTGTHHFRKAYPERFFQFGIAEQNMMSAAAGFAAVGLIPVVTTFGVFCLRAVEQARLSIAYARRNVKIVASHPGLDVGPDGASAQVLEDLASFRAIPGMTVLSPADPAELKAATRAMLDYDGPVYMRSGRSPVPRIYAECRDFKIGRGSVVRTGGDLTIVACGVQVARALRGAMMLEESGVHARVINMSTIKPIDCTLLALCAEETGALVVTEDHNVFGGLGGAVAEALAGLCPVPIEFVGVHDLMGQSGEPDELVEHYGIGPSAIARAARRVLDRKEEAGVRISWQQASRPRRLAGRKDSRR